VADLLTCRYCSKQSEDVRNVLVGDVADMICKECLLKAIAGEQEDEQPRDAHPGADTPQNLAEIERLTQQGDGIPRVNLREFELDLENLTLVPEVVCREYVLIPLGRIEDTLYVALSDERAARGACEHLRHLTGYDVEPALGDEDSIIQLINKVFR